MKNFALPTLKHLLTLAGQRLPNKHLLHLQATLNYLKLGRWMHEHDFHLSGRVSNRLEVWASVSKQVTHHKVLYLEFGVYLGESMRYWSRELKNPESRLHGFDSFEGLPEEGGPWHKGQFDAGGVIPVIDDPRVQFFKGSFDQVLPTYSVPPHDVLVINMDAAPLFLDDLCFTPPASIHQTRSFHILR